jgi:hypothetical protein
MVAGRASIQNMNTQILICKMSVKHTFEGMDDCSLFTCININKQPELRSPYTEVGCKKRKTRRISQKHEGTTGGK